MNLSRDSSLRQGRGLLVAQATVQETNFGSTTPTLAGDPNRVALTLCAVFEVDDVDLVSVTVSAGALLPIATVVAVLNRYAPMVVLTRETLGDAITRPIFVSAQGAPIGLYLTPVYFQPEI